MTPEIRAALHGHWMRAGLSIADFFRTIEDPPVGLTCGMVRRWLSDNAPRRVRKDHLECVLAAWEKLPAGQGHPRSIHFIPFAGEGRQEEIPLR